MLNNYQVIEKHDNIGLMVRKLHKEEELAVGIMDTGTQEELLQSITWFRKNFMHNIHVITQSQKLDRETISSLDDVTFILFEKAPTLGQRINAMANTCMSTYFLITRSDTDLVDLNWSDCINMMGGEKNPVVLSPLIFNKNKELIPSVRAPHLEKDIIEPISSMPSKGNDCNLYPFLGMGLYNRALFQRIRGFDEEITSAYWQSIDFGTKSWLFGYPIYSVNSIATIFYSKQFLIEDRTETGNFERFYSRALGIQIVNGRQKFKKVKYGDKKVLTEEVRTRAGLYKTDFETLCKTWQFSEED